MTEAAAQPIGEHAREERAGRTNKPTNPGAVDETEGGHHPGAGDRQEQVGNQQQDSGGPAKAAARAQQPREGLVPDQKRDHQDHCEAQRDPQEPHPASRIRMLKLVARPGMMGFR